MKNTRTTKYQRDLHAAKHNAIMRYLMAIGAQIGMRTYDTPRYRWPGEGKAKRPKWLHAQLHSDALDRRARRRARPQGGDTVPNKWMQGRLRYVE